MKILQEATRGCSQLYIPNSWRQLLVVFSLNDDGSNGFGERNEFPRLLEKRLGMQENINNLIPRLSGMKRADKLQQREERLHFKYQQHAVFVHHNPGEHASQFILGIVCCLISHIPVFI